MNFKKRAFSTLTKKEISELSLEQIKNKIDDARKLEQKEIERTIRYWQGKIKYAEMRIKENKNKLKELQ
jgi:ribonuclease I